MNLLVIPTFRQTEFRGINSPNPRGLSKLHEVSLLYLLTIGSSLDHCSLIFENLVINWEADVGKLLIWFNLLRNEHVMNVKQSKLLRFTTLKWLGWIWWADRYQGGRLIPWLWITLEIVLQITRVLSGFLEMMSLGLLPQLFILLVLVNTELCTDPRLWLSLTMPRF